MRYVPGGARDRAGSLARLRSLIAHQAAHGFSKRGVILRSSHEIIGDCGLQYLDGGPEIELGFHIAQAHWGYGYATEAASACLAGAQTERAEPVVAIVDQDNAPSIRVLNKIGMHRAGTKLYLDRVWDLYVPVHP
jgi:RimJ/RimL family protein N-acetyltransferase